MEQSRNGGGGKVEEPMAGRRHQTGPRSTYLDGDRVARPLQPQGAVSRRRTYADGELDVFAAERYFKGAMDGDHRRKEDGVAASARPAVAVAKPAASSAASANSQTMLLRRRRDHRDSKKKCCVQVGVLMRSCSGKRSVRVDSGVAEGVSPGASRIDWYKELRMQKAALGLGPGDGVVAAAAALPPNLNTTNLGTAKVAAIGREDRVADFTSSASRRRSFTLVAPVRANVVDDDDDGAGSESSSDLFEIKSLMIDECPYEPSEASIQWSVATADASSERVSASGRQSRDRLLSGCVSHRAVEVPRARRRGEGFHKARNGA